MEQTLYGGKFKYTFTEGNHVHKIDGNKKKGVTTIIGRVLAKPALMLWPLDTAINYLKSLDYIIEEDDLDTAYNLHKKKSDFGSSTGKEVHALVEQFLKKEIIPEVELELEVARAFKAFRDWFDQVKPKVIAVECPVYSKEYDYCGLFDSVLEINGKTYLCDLKTSNASRTAPKGVYPEHFIQLGAYLQAYSEEKEFSKLPKIEGLMVISCRKDGKVDIVTNEDIGLSLADTINNWLNVLNLFRYLERVSKTLERI